MDLRGRLAVVVGLGRSGVAAARLLVARGARVMGTDLRPEAELAAEARALPIAIRAGGHRGVEWEEADLVVVSPGVPPLEELDRAEQRGALVIGELELAWRFVEAPVVAVGGTNGKSTVTTAAARLFEAAGLRVFAGGNLGTPLSEAVGGGFDLLCVEVSSFQLERAPTFRPRASILLNVTEDHLDRYPSFEAYAEAKGNAFANQGEGDYAIVPEGDAVCLGQARRGRGRTLTFGPGGDYEVAGGAVLERATGERFALEGADFRGAHNRSNAAAAIAAARALGVEAAAIAAGLRRFVPLGHRLALVREVDGVRYYDDSKATNVGAAVTALAGLAEERAVLIAGGRDKLGSYAPLAEALGARGRALVLLGEAAERIAGAVGDRVPVVRAAHMDEAVERARSLARPGDAVLLAPACSSFDMFASYAERGDRFAEAVRRLEPRRAS